MIISKRDFKRDLNLKIACARNVMRRTIYSMHELRYFQEIHALSNDIDVLWSLKCQAVLNDEFQDLSALKIYFDGKEEWIFDYLPTKKQASQYIVGELCPPFLLAKVAKRFGVKGSAEALHNRRLK